MSCSYHSFPWGSNLLPLDRWSSFLEESLEEIGECVELVVEEFLVILIGGIDELVELGSEGSLSVLTHQLLEFDD